MMKIYLLLTIISMFVGLSFVPLRTQAKQTVSKNAP